MFTTVIASGNGETTSFGATQWATGGAGIDGKGFGGDEHPAWSLSRASVGGIGFGKGGAGGMDGFSAQGRILIEWGY